MSQKTKLASLEVHLEGILGDYLELGELVREFQKIKNRKNLAHGKYIFNRALEKRVQEYQKHLARLSYRGIQIEQKLLEEVSQS